MPFGACSLWPEREQVDLGTLQVDRHLADGLHRIGVEQRTRFVREFGQDLHRKDRARLVIGPHHAGDGRLRAQRTTIGLDIQPPAGVHEVVVDLHAAALLQPGAESEDRRMLDLRRDDLVAPALGLERGEQRGVVGFRAAARPDDLVVELGAEQRLHLLPCRLQRSADRRAEGMHGRGIAELLREEWRHGLDRRRIDTGGGVVVEINRPHFSAPSQE